MYFHLTDRTMDVPTCIARGKLRIRDSGTISSPVVTPSGRTELLAIGVAAEHFRLRRLESEDPDKVPVALKRGEM